MQITDDIISIKGVGEKTAEVFNKVGIYTVSDLINTYPRNYLMYSEPIPIADCEEGERVAVFGSIISSVDVRKVRNLTLTNLTIRDSSGSIRVTWYNSPFLRNVFRRGDSYVFVGVVRFRNSTRVMEVPEYYTEEKYEQMVKTLQPVYPLTAGLTNNTFIRAIRNVSELICQAEDYLPAELIEEFGIMPRGKALFSMHFPKDMDELREACGRMAFDEFLLFILEMKQLKEKRLNVANSHKLTNEAVLETEEFIKGLPFTLTAGQRAAVDDIISDMSSDNVANRLVQGDVGSGKTMVAAAALFAAAKSGFQGALMVPTEVLAMQHYKDLSRLFEPYGIKVALLTGSVSLKDKRHIYQSIKEQKTDIVIGTHAIIQDKTEFKNLGVVVCDEQHRFGVNQRQKLSEKGDMPHTIIMSATPIPRTIAIIMYADMDISVIKELPNGRLPIKNCVVGTEYRTTAYNFIRDEILAGHQAYVICPMVEDSPALDAENVVDYSETIRNHIGKYGRIDYIHGRMSEEDKNMKLQEFISGDIKVLVSTTVIEVGINNPNATVMMIENAERFGLAQLHQLRGRVGRGNAQSYCVFINCKKSRESAERLEVLRKSNDGFFIASEDLKLRGPGDFFGIRQSGDVMFRFGDIYKHPDMLKKAQEVAIKYHEKIEGEKIWEIMRKTKVISTF